MELRHLRYFVAVADAMSVSKSALAVHVSQPSLSRQIHDLEHELGVRLFGRVGRRIELTVEGTDLLEWSRDVLTRATALGERARALSAGTVGVLGVGATPQVMQTIVADFLPTYTRRHPGVEVRLIDDGGARLLDLVRRGEVQLVLSGILPGTHLARRLLFPIRLIAVTRRSARWARQRTVDVAELAGIPLLLLHQDFGTRQLFDAACRVAHVQPRVVAESREPSSLLRLADRGHGIAIVPSTVPLVTKHLHAMPLLREGSSLGAWGGVIWNASRFLPVYATGFVDELAAELRGRYPGRQFERISPPVPQPPAEAET